MRSNHDLLAAGLVSVVYVMLALAAPDTPLRGLLGLPLVLFLPGYAVLAALFPRREDLDGVERLSLSFVLSLALVPLVVLILNFAPGGIRFGSLSACLGGIVVASLLIAGDRRLRLSPADRVSVDAASVLMKLWVRRRNWMPLTAMVLASAVWVGVRLHASVPAAPEPFTEFYVFGPPDTPLEYPHQILAGESATVVVGITNHESRRVAYKVVVQTGSRSLAALGPIGLDHNQRWTQSVRFVPPAPASREDIEILLFKDNGTIPYRHLHLWVTVGPG